MPTLESWMVSDQILPALPKINSKEPGILMAILGIYKLANENEKFGIGREQCAKSVLPFLISTTVENTLNLHQFEQYVTMIKILLEKVEKEQRNRLQQLSAGQEEQRNFQDFTEMINSDTTKVNSGPDLDALSELFGPTKTDNGVNGSSKQPGQLSLEEKKRLALENEKPTILEPMKPTKSQPMNSMMSTTNKTAAPLSTATNSLFDTGLSKPLSMFPSPPKSTISDSFNFDNLMSTVSPAKNDSNFGNFSSSSMNSSTFSIPPPPSSSNPVQRSGFSIPPPPGNNSNFINLNFGTSSSTKGNDDILDLFKSNQPKQQNSTAVDELLAMANKMPVSNKSGKNKDPFADLLK
uniref:SCY1-like protein 2 n=1 Tax=Panagrolaimus sp. JU765 TaxID=591449 RepID=A0AC34QMY0_9BILA